MTKPKIGPQHFEALVKVENLFPLVSLAHATSLNEITAILRASEERIEALESAVHDAIDECETGSPWNALDILMRVSLQAHQPLTTNTPNFYTSSPDHGEDLW